MGKPVLPLRRYRVVFEVQVWADGPEQAFMDAGLLAQCLKPIPAEVFKTMGLPVSSVQGEPRTPESPGWRCVYEINED